MKKNIQRGRKIKEQLNKFINRIPPDNGKIGKLDQILDQK
jgi:hypothetical protein